VKRTSLIVVMLGALCASADPITPPTLTPDEVKQLEAGSVVSHTLRPTDDRGVAIEAFGLVEAPSSEVFPVVRDCHRFAQFMPRTVASSRTAEQLCHVELAMPFPVGKLWSESKSELTEEPPGHFKRSWTLVRGSYRRNSGSFTVVPWGDGTRSLVRWAVDSDPGLFLPDALLRSAQVGSLPALFTAIRARVVKLRQAEP
jgi:Polyketide cyclase / dehydrase and lipid transport